jgi:hypothetical protein
MRRLTGTLVVLVAMLGACSSVPRDNDGNLTEPITMSVFDLEVGDCFDDPDDLAEISEIDAMPCDLSHDNEVFTILSHPLSGEDWPGRDPIEETAFATCVEQFDVFVGVAYADSRLAVAYFTPTEDGWDAGDDEVVCFLYDIDLQKLTRSMRGSGE